MLSILTTLGGAIFGGVQTYIENHQRTAKEIKLAQIKYDRDLAIAKYKALPNKTKEDKGLLTRDLNSARLDALSTCGRCAQNCKVITTANFVVSTTRPFITYLLLFLVMYASVKLLNSDSDYVIKRVTMNGGLKETPILVVVFDLILAEFSAVMSYWFVRRSHEKKYYS